MPIRPDQRWLYPIDWRELSRLVRFERARGCCEHCGRPHLCWVATLADGLWWDETLARWRDRRGRRLAKRYMPAQLLSAQATLAGFEPPVQPRSFVVLATAHLDHDPANNRLRNLAALCQRCHLAHDRAEHRRRRWATLFHRRALGDLFAGAYG